MALTKYQSPQIYTPAYNEQVFVYLSDQIGISGFQYIVTTVVGGVTYTDKIYPRPDGFLVFDTMERVKNLITTYYNPDSNLHVCVPEYTYVAVTVAESLGTLDSDFTAYGAFNACLKKQDFNNYNYLEWYRTSIAQYSNQKIFQNEFASDTNIDNFLTRRTASYLTMQAGILSVVTYFVYNESNTLVRTGNFTIPFASLPEILRFDVGVYAMANECGIPLHDGYRYELSFKDSAGNILAFYSSPIINDVCTKYGVYRLFFLKRNGAIGYKTFEKVSELKVDKKINEVNLNPSTLFSDGSGGYIYGYPKDKHFSNVVSTQSTYTLSLNSDWITEAQSIKLEELFDSPKVWLQDDKDGSIIAVNIKESSYTFKKHINEPLFNYNVTVELSQQETRQRGI